uniref:Uncharacterized protein LOC105648813 n=1 Tax=Rhizophora mucronata TaxID=61149 RepID=A0A2P2MDD8_RHIMU
MLSSTMPSLSPAAEGLKNGGLENMPSKCSKLLLETPGRCRLCSAPLIWTAVPCVFFRPEDKVTVG